MKLLIVEDDPNLGFILQDHLEDNGFIVTRCTDGEEAFRIASNETFDLCIVDVMLPKMDGFNLVKKIRYIDEKTPVIFVTAKSMKEDKIEGFKVGADDYLTKPFSMEELLMRIHAILRRTQTSKSQNETFFTFGIFQFDSNTRELSSKEVITKLTGREAEILQMLVSNINETLTREEILMPIWGDDSYHNSRSLDVFITKLRKHIKSDETLEILSVHSKGFKLITSV